jgi:hypothetical protein
LAAGASAGDLVETVSFFVSSVLNAIPATAGAVTSAYLLDGSVTQAKLAAGVGATGPLFNCNASGSFSVPSSTDTKVPINTVVYDTNNCFNTSTNRFTPNVAGYYQVQGAVFISPPNNTSGFILQIFKNGALFQQVHRDQYEVNFNQLACGGTIVYCNGTTDYLELYVWQNGGSTQTFGNNGTVTWFSGAMIRAA